MEKSSGRATEDGSLSQDRHAADVMYTEQTKIAKLQHGKSG